MVAETPRREYPVVLYQVLQENLAQIGKRISGSIPQKLRNKSILATKELMQVHCTILDDAYYCQRKKSVTIIFITF